MMKRTHKAIALAAIMPILRYTKIDIIGLVGILGATAPDLDYKLGIKHRTITHSLLALVTTSLSLYLISKDIATIWFVSYLLHLIADSFTKMGVPFLYPFKKRRYGLRKITTRSATDYSIQMLAIMCIIMFIYSCIVN